MKSTVRGALCALALLVVVGLVHAQVPRALNYQGYLSTAGGAPVNTTVQLRFRLYDAATGGNLLWSEGPVNVTVTNGLFSVALGSTTSFPPSLTFDRPYFLGVQVGADPEMTPRQPLLPSPYSLRATIADAVNPEVPLQLGSDYATPCNSGRAGSLRWNAPLTALEVCDGSAWKKVAYVAAPSTYTVGGSISGLNGTIVLRNGTDTVTRSVNGPFTFPLPLIHNATYNVTIDSPPAGQNCQVTNGSGTINAAIVTNVMVSCSDIVPGASAQIAAARATADGPASLPIANAIVTYVRPAVGADPAGFFIQAEATGPALFIAVEASTLSPAPVPADVVAFTITSMGTTAGGLRQATAIAAYSRTSQGAPVSALVQNAPSNLVSALASYESELMSAFVMVTDEAAPSGSGFVAVAVSTSSIPSQPDFRLRMPSSLFAQQELTPACELVVTAPIWRFGAQAQVSPMVLADLTTIFCPHPYVTGVVATSPTSVTITFSRTILAGSVNSSGADFSIPGLTVTSAVASGRTVTLGTSVQTPGAPYAVTVTGSIVDTTFQAVDPGGNSGQFNGYQPPD